MKLLFHTNYTPLFIFNVKSIGAYKLLLSNFCFFFIEELASSTTPIEEMQVVHESILIIDNLLSPYLNFDFAIFYDLPCLIKLLQ
jgi:hypothetical protein